MTRVLVHAGFHKTGTSSLQDYLNRHRATLSPWLSYYGKDDLPAAGRAARAYGQRPFVWRRRRFGRLFAAFLAGIPDAPTIVISRETFCGVMPGHRDWRGRTVRDYASRAIPLCREIVAALRRRFGAQTEISFLFTTREGESWIASVYGHLVRSIHLREDFATFRAGFPETIDLGAEAGRIAGALSPVPLLTVALEEVGGGGEGPARVVLDFSGVPADVRATLPAARRVNLRQSPELENEFLRLNRTGGAKAGLKAAKDRLLREQRK